jgi:outer membrane protein assembly factor BamA
VLLFITQTLFAQSEFIVIDSILIDGNKRTRTENALRELSFSVGDTVRNVDLTKLFKQNELLLKSTGLFSKVIITNISKTPPSSTINIVVEEAWYIYPLINISFADRNFNVWWVEQNHKLNRLNYTFQVSHRNLTGRRDLLTTYIQLGYEPKFQLTYDLPYFNKAKTLGLRGDIFYAQAKEWGLSTTENRLDLVNNEDSVMIRRFRLTAGLRYQKGVFNRQDVELRFHQHEISEYAGSVNPDFFLNGNKLQQYFALTYKFTTDYRDFKPYPLKGYFLSTAITKEGFGIFRDINTLLIEPNFAYYQPIYKKFSAAFDVRGKVSLIRSKPPYFNSRAIGYRPNHLRGFEYYVIDGLDYMMTRASLRYEWLDKNLSINKKKENRKRKYFPLKIYSTIFQDNAYANNPFYDQTNTFSNQHLWSIGTGLNFVIYNDFVLQVEYTWNEFNESDLYLHFELPF